MAVGNAFESDKSSAGRKRRIIRAADRDSAGQAFQTSAIGEGGRGSDEENVDPNVSAYLYGADGAGGDSTSDVENGGVYDEEEEDGHERPRIPLLERDEEEGEDLYGDGMEQDYKEMPHLDTYSSSQLDDTEYAPLDMESRHRIDAELNRRDYDQARRLGRIPEMFLADPDDMAGVTFDSRRVNRQILLGEAGPGISRRGLSSEGDATVGEDMLSPEAITEAEAAGYALPEFLSMENCRRRVARDYMTFLTTYLDEQGQSVYNAKIKALCAANQESLEVSYGHLAGRNPFLAKLLANCPKETLAIFDEATFRVILEQFPEYHRIKSEIHVRIADVPTVDALRDLRHTHLNTLVRVTGVVTRRTGVFPQLKLVKFSCQRCGVLLGPFTQDAGNEREISPGRCSACDSKGPFQIHDSTTVYRNYQKIALQESPSAVPAGRLPRTKDVVLLWDLIDSVRPGDEIQVTGIYRNNYAYSLNTKNGFPVFATLIEANWVGSASNAKGLSDAWTDDDIREIKALAQDPVIGQRVIASIAPSIYGHATIKTALALSLFGGQSKSVQGGRMTLRGDINVLLLGDPGTAKSQFLKYVSQIAPRAIYTTGQGASAVGLTAAVRKDPLTREWTLEGGALVLADQGHCLIDEFDKMNDADRTSIHEAMEQQTISISKAGIVATLHARCAVVAAANPIRGRYNPSVPFASNVALTDPILSRFDVLCVVRDLVDPVLDNQLAQFVVHSHMASHPSAVQTDVNPVAGRGVPMTQSSSPSSIKPLDQAILKKYIAYARGHIFPTMRSIDVDKVSSIYADLRQQSLASGGIPITVRHVESIIRMAEASARMHLRPNVLPKDIDLAIRVALESFISAQKFSITKRLQKAFSKYISLNRDHFELLLFTLQQEMRLTLRYYQSKFAETSLPAMIEISQDAFEGKAIKDLSIPHASLISFYKSPSFQRPGYILQEDRGVILFPSPVGRED